MYYLILKMGGSMVWVSNPHAKAKRGNGPYMARLLQRKRGMDLACGGQRPGLTDYWHGNCKWVERRVASLMPS